MTPGKEVSEHFLRIMKKIQINKNINEQHWTVQPLESRLIISFQFSRLYKNEHQMEAGAGSSSHVNYFPRTSLVRSPTQQVCFFLTYIHTYIHISLFVNRRFFPS